MIILRLLNATILIAGIFILLNLVFDRTSPQMVAWLIVFATAIVADFLWRRLESDLRMVARGTKVTPCLPLGNGLPGNWNCGVS